MRPSHKEVTASQVLAQLAGKLLPATWCWSEDQGCFRTVAQLVAMGARHTLDQNARGLLGLSWRSAMYQTNQLFEAFDANQS